MSADMEASVADHYTTGALFERIKDALRDTGVDPDHAKPSDLTAGDQFHTGGLAATEHLVGQLLISSETEVLDVGCGIGGTSRYIAHATGARITGVDLTLEFIETARELSALVGLEGQTEYHVGSALDMPVQDSGFDMAVMMHVGMNIADKATLFHDVARVLKPGGTFALFEVMRGPEPSDLIYPLPWSSAPDTSFLGSPSHYAEAAEAAGFTCQTETDRSDFAKNFFEEVRRNNETEGPSPFGIGLMMGETAQLKLGNYVKNLVADRVRPTEMIFELTE